MEPRITVRLNMGMNLTARLAILADAAKYHASCVISRVPVAERRAVILVLAGSARPSGQGFVTVTHRMGGVFHY